MKRTLSAGAVLVVLAVTSPARADVPEWKDLPSGHVTSLPTKKFPGGIGAREKVAGFRFAPLDHGRTRADVTIVDAKADGSACFAAVRQRLTDDDVTRDDRAFPEWFDGLSSAATVSGGVNAIHREEVVEDEKGARLESVDAWVDSRTRGVRRFASATIPLKLVGSSVGGLKVYAARDERDDGKFAQIVLVPKRGKDAPSPSLMAVTASRGSRMSTGCGHHRVALSAEKSEGDTAIVTTTLVLGPSDETSMRVREVSVQASISQTKSDPDPVVSVSFGWSGRETTRRIGEDGSLIVPGDGF